MKQCFNCYHELSDRATYCPYCGEGQVMTDLFGRPLEISEYLKKEEKEIDKTDKSGKLGNKEFK